MSSDKRRIFGRTLGLINARGGSKGIPNKNIRPLGGMPLIAWSIKTALSCPSIDAVVVSTDSEAIAEAARSFGARVPFLRPAELASDKALQIDAIRHAVGFLADRGESFDQVVILQPTAPFRTVEDVEGTLAAFHAANTDSAISVIEVSRQHPLTLYTMTEGRVTPFMPANTAGVLRQEFSKVYWRTGAVYVTKCDVVTQQRSLYGQSTCGYIMPEERAINLDTLFDWEFAEFYLHRQLKA